MRVNGDEYRVKITEYNSLILRRTKWKAELERFGNHDSLSFRHTRVIERIGGYNHPQDAFDAGSRRLDEIENPPPKKPQPSRWYV